MFSHSLREHFVVQVLVLDQTKTVAECAQQLLYAAKESGGNPKATHVHADIDESAEAISFNLNFAGFLAIQSM